MYSICANLKKLEKAKAISHWHLPNLLSSVMGTMTILERHLLVAENIPIKYRGMQNAVYAEIIHVCIIWRLCRTNSYTTNYWNKFHLKLKFIKRRHRWTGILVRITSYWVTVHHRTFSQLGRGISAQTACPRGGTCLWYVYVKHFSFIKSILGFSLLAPPLLSKQWGFQWDRWILRW